MPTSSTCSTRGNSLCCCFRGGFDYILGKVSLLKVEGVRPWNRLYREVVESPSLDVFKKHGGMWLLGLLLSDKPTGAGLMLDSMILRLFSRLSDSMIHEPYLFSFLYFNGLPVGTDSTSCTIRLPESTLQAFGIHWI